MGTFRHLILTLSFLAHRCDFTFDPLSFPDPAAYLSKIKKDYGVRVCLWINPYFGQASPLFQEGLDGGFFIQRKNGDVWQWDLWQPGLAVLDVTNPAACEWYVSKLEALLDMGIDAFKVGLPSLRLRRRL